MWKSCHACIYGNKSILCLAQSFVRSDFQHFQVVVTSWSTFWRCPGTGVVNNPKPLPTTITSGVELTDPSIFFLFFVSKQSSRNRKNLEAHHSCVISESRLLGTLKSSRRKKKEKMATDWKKKGKWNKWRFCFSDEFRSERAISSTPPPVTKATWKCLPSTITTHPRRPPSLSPGKHRKLWIFFFFCHNGRCRSKFEAMNFVLLRHVRSAR